MDFIFKVKERRSIVGREEELNLLKESFHKKRMKNSILVGSAGSGKTTLVEKLAYDLKQEYLFRELSLGAILAGTRYRGELEEKVINCLDTLKKSPKPVILFIDEIHTITSCGGVEGAAIGLGDIIKPYLSSGEITVIGATTPEEYWRTIYKDKALNRRLSPIFISDLDDDTVLKILDKFADKKVNKEILKYILEQTSSRAMVNPDASIEVLDRCMARNAVTGNEIDNNMVDSIVKILYGYNPPQLTKNETESENNRRIAL